MKNKIVVMASGEGTTFQEIYQACSYGRINAEVVALISDRLDSGAVVKAGKLNVPVIHYSLTKKEIIIRELEKLKPDLIVLAGFLKILPEEFIDNFAGKIVNTHPSLLPCFGGKGMYGINVQHAVLKSGTKVTGCTIHLVDKDVDHGPIIAQETVPVLSTDTPESLQIRVHSVELGLYVDAISTLLKFDHTIVGNRVKFLNQFSL
jgi:phosphoribosylglycinamide formyltransferase-1